MINIKTLFLYILFLSILTGIGCTTVRYYPVNFVESLKHPTKFPEIFDFAVENIEEMAEKNPLGDDEYVKIKDVGENRNSSMHLIQVRRDAEILSHYHKHHDEILYVKKGRGIAILDGTRYMVKAGSILQVPSKTVHKFLNTGDETFMALSIFSPPFDGRDKKILEEEKKVDRGARREKRLAGKKPKKNKDKEKENVVSDKEKQASNEAIIATPETLETSEEENASKINHERITDTIEEQEPLHTRKQKASKKEIKPEKPPANIMELHEKLTKLLQLKESGTISASEYEKLKDKLILGKDIGELPEPTKYAQKEELPFDEDALNAVEEYSNKTEENASDSTFYTDRYSPGTQDNDSQQYTYPDNDTHDNKYYTYEETEKEETAEIAPKTETYSREQKLQMLEEMRLEGLISKKDYEQKKFELTGTIEDDAGFPSQRNVSENEKLKELEELYNEGLITEEDYALKYKELTKQQNSAMTRDNNRFHKNEKVEELKELYHKGLITEENYHLKYKELTGQSISQNRYENERLSELQRLLEEGKITKEDYEFKKALLSGD